MRDKELVYRWLNKQIKAQKLIATTLFDNKVRREYLKKDVQLFTGVKLLADTIGAELIECEWDGNDHCGTNYIERSFMYKGYKFYSINEKEGYEKEDEANEGK